MSRVERPPISGPAQLNSQSPNPFGALLSAAIQDPSAARGLAMAYSTLDCDQRWTIIDAIVTDADGEGIAASEVLIALLSVEDDVNVATHIADAIASLGGSGLEPAARTRAMAAGDELHGGVVVIRPLHGTFTEVVGMAWCEGQAVTHVEFEPLIHDGKAGDMRKRLPNSLTFETVPVAFAIDMVAPVLWRHRRIHGELPECVERFADLFSIAPHHDQG